MLPLLLLLLFLSFPFSSCDADLEVELARKPFELGGAVRVTEAVKLRLDGGSRSPHAKMMRVMSCTILDNGPACALCAIC